MKSNKVSIGDRVLYQKRHSVFSPIIEGEVKEISLNEKYIKINEYWYKQDELAQLLKLKPLKII